MKQLFVKVCAALAGLAMFTTQLNVNATCTWLVHQPELPKRAERLKRF